MSPDGALLGVQSSLFRHCVVIGGISVRLWFSFQLFKAAVCFNQLGPVLDKEFILMPKPSTSPQNRITFSLLYLENERPGQNNQERKVQPNKNGRKHHFDLWIT